MVEVVAEEAVVAAAQVVVVDLELEGVESEAVDVEVGVEVAEEGPLEVVEVCTQI